MATFRQRSAIGDPSLEEKTKSCSHRMAGQDVSDTLTKSKQPLTDLQVSFAFQYSRHPRNPCGSKILAGAPAHACERWVRAAFAPYQMLPAPPRHPNPHPHPHPHHHREPVCVSAGASPTRFRDFGARTKIRAQNRLRGLVPVGWGEGARRDAITGP